MKIPQNHLAPDDFFVVVFILKKDLIIDYLRNIEKERVINYHNSEKDRNIIE